jgi:hypothetical protein
MVKKLPKWAIKQAGGINKKAWRLAKAGRKPKKSSSRKTYKTSTKRKSNRRRNNMNLGNKAIVGGIIAGAAATMIKRYVNAPFADDLAVLGTGIFMKDKTLQTIGAVGLGSDLGSMFPGGNGGNGGYL